MMDYAAILAKQFGVQQGQVQNVISLLDEGNTVPFIARYRKEATGSLDDRVLRSLYERLIPNHFSVLTRKSRQLNTSRKETR